MNRFWLGVGVLFAIAVVLLVTVNGDEDRANITFTDLETECRLDQGATSSVNLRDDNALAFRGHFPENSTRAELDYNFRANEDKVVLNIISESEEEDEIDFLDRCLASVVYEAHTEPLVPGDYSVTVKHNGRTVSNQIIGVKRE